MFYIILKMVGFYRVFQRASKMLKTAVLEHLELKIFFAAHPWWVAFKKAIIDLKNIPIYIFPLFRPLSITIAHEIYRFVEIMSKFMFI